MLEHCGLPRCGCNARCGCPRGDCRCGPFYDRQGDQPEQVFTNCDNNMDVSNRKADDPGG